MMNHISRMTVLPFVLLALMLMPASASAATASQTIAVYATGKASTNWYYYSSGVCNTGDDFVTYMHRGGPSYAARGITPAMGNVYEHFDAVGNSAWGKAYFFRESSGVAFDFYFEGTLQCIGSTYGIVRGQWTFGYAYTTDPATGQELCTRLDGLGTVEVRVDFLRRATTTVVSGSYTRGATEICQ